MFLQEFVIHTPTPDASKIYIGNALQGHYAAVFAQLYVNDQCKGTENLFHRPRNQSHVCAVVQIP